jgi:hypothetical protein
MPQLVEDPDNKVLRQYKNHHLRKLLIFQALLENMTAKAYLLGKIVMLYG